MQYFQIPPTDALLAHNTIHNLTVGDRRPRTNPRGRPLQPAIGRSAYESADNVHCSHALTTAGAWRLARYGLRFTALRPIPERNVLSALAFREVQTRLDQSEVSAVFRGTSQ